MTLGAASLIALACQLVAPLVAVPVIFGVLFLARLRSGRTWTVAERNARTSPIELPDLIWYSDVGAQAAIRRLGQARRALANAVAHSPQDPEHEILARLRSVADIERRIVLLASRVEYLGQVPGRDLAARDRGGGAAHPRQGGERDHRRSSSALSARNRATRGAAQGCARPGGAARSAVGHN